MNQINVIAPYKYLDMWVFDDPQKDLFQEPFVGGADVLLDRLTAALPNASSGFSLIFSASPFQGFEHVMAWRRAELNGNVYYSRDLDLEGWLCPALLQYFDAAPAELYVQLKPAATPKKPMDETLLAPDSTAIAPPPRLRRIPNLLHAFLFVCVTGFLLMLLQLILAAIGKSPATIVGGKITLTHPLLQLGVMAATYVVTLAAAWLLFPLVWRRRFLDGLQWNFAAAKKRALFLIASGLFLGFSVAMITRLITPPKSLPVDQFFSNASTAWLITLFGVIVAPIFEEICFRGFLVPAFAIAYDWIALPRTPEARLHWQGTTDLSRPAYIFSAILSSLFFALLHAQQVAHLLPVLITLFTVSLILTYVRVSLRSVACSVFVHSAYNSFIFLVTIVATGGYRHLDRMTN